MPTAIGGTLASDGSPLITIQPRQPALRQSGQAWHDRQLRPAAGLRPDLKQAYKSAIQYFYDLGIRHFDLDIEGPALSIDQWASTINGFCV